MITCERCGESFQAKPNKDGSFNGFGLQRDDGTYVNVCARCFNILMGMPLKQIKEFVEGADRHADLQVLREDLPDGDQI